jgi:hypothetical protein
MPVLIVLDLHKKIYVDKRIFSILEVQIDPVCVAYLISVQVIINIKYLLSKFCRYLGISMHPKKIIGNL